MTTLAGTLVFIGAGCGRGSIAVPAPQANLESDIALRADNLQSMPSAESGGSVSTSATVQAGNQAQPTEQTWPLGQRPTKFPGILPAAQIHDKQVRIVTGKGTIIFKLYDADAPMAVSNFVALAASGFYDGLTFHRVEPGFVIQGGDPLGNGRGGPGYQFEDEPVKRDYLNGTVAMANAGPDTNGSQFFICLGDQPLLPKNYTIFGQVTSGLDVIQKIKIGDVMKSVTVEAIK